MKISGSFEPHEGDQSPRSDGDGLYEALELLQDVFRAIATEAPASAQAGREAFSHIVRLPEDAAAVSRFQLRSMVRRITAGRPTTSGPVSFAPAPLGP